MSETSSSPIPAAEREFREAMSASRRPVHDSVVDRHLARAQHFALTGIAEMLAEICERLRPDLVEAAPEAEGWVDRNGDVWRDGGDGLMHSFETRPFPREHVEKKWGPLRPVSEAPAPRDAQRLVGVRHDDLASLLSGWVDGASVSVETEDRVRAALRGETR